tara:strand:+ start:5952 stop:6107 length:156 start_codon:yes stop_codon:yes gene_type:complete
MITTTDLQRVVNQINGRFDALNQDIAALQKQVEELTKEKANGNAKKGQSKG